MATTGGVQDLVTPDCTLGYRPLAVPHPWTSPHGNVGQECYGSDPQGFYLSQCWSTFCIFTLHTISIEDPFSKKKKKPDLTSVEK